MPWGLQACQRRRRIGRLIPVLWATYPAWFVAGLVLDSVTFWLVPIGVYILATLGLVAALSLSLRTYWCVDCGLAWRARIDGTLGRTQP